MRRKMALFLFCLLAGNLLAQLAENKQVPDLPGQLKQLKKEVSLNLTQNILPFWSKKMIDHVNGGFYGRMDGNNKLYPAADKGGILNARILWTFSSAFRVMKDSAYLKTATRARDYILAHFIDTLYGGAYLSVNSTGKPADTRKQIYTQAFFIYALTEYYRVTADEEALSAAKDIYEKIEKYGHDNQFDGYFEVYSRDWKRISDKLISEKSDQDQKGMNTHLHILEAYTNLYRVWPDEKVAGRLRNLILLFKDKIVNQQRFHLNYFMNEKWESTSFVDSYGHDIEASWLLLEAARVLDDPALTAEIGNLCIPIANAAGEGLQADGSLIYEKECNTGELDMNRQWWAQAEAVVGFVNAFELTGDDSYAIKAINTWKYIDKNLVDHIHGEWFNTIDAHGIRSGDKAGPWKCPYHNSRMCMEIIERVVE
jgi:cellobiose epimerase